MLVKVVPAILTQSEDELVEKLTILAAKGGEVHLDIMDGDLTDRRSVNLFTSCHLIRDLAAKVALELHLMVKRPTDYLQLAVALSARAVILHQESFSSRRRLWQTLNDFWDENLATVLTAWPRHRPLLLTDVTEYQVMGVVPGRAGQRLLPDTADRVETLRRRSADDIIVSVDGGVTFNNAVALGAAGANRVIMNSAFWEAENPILSTEQLIKEGYGLQSRH